MPLGSALKSTIDIDFTRAQGVNSSGHITFEPPRTRVGTTMLSPFPIVVPIVNGVATVHLVRLPAGTYYVREAIDGRARYEFNFALPLNSIDLIQYEDLAPVNPVPIVYTSVRTINGVAPNPTTGNIVVDVSGGGATNLDALTDVVIASPANGHSIVYDGTDSRWENRLLTASDVGASPTGHAHAIEIVDVTELSTALSGKSPVVHTHSSSQITDFQTAVDTRVQLIVDAAPSALDTLNELAAALGDDPDFAGTVTVALSNKQPLDSDLTTIAGLTPTDNDILQRISGAWTNRTLAQLKTGLSLSKADVGLPNVDNTSDANKPVSIATAASIAERALPNRIVRIKDKTKEGAGNTYDLPNTADAWALFGAGPAEYTIAANIGDDISLYYDFLMQTHVSSFFDFAVVTGGTPTVQRYLASGSSTPTFNGPSGSYPSNEGFQGVKGTLGFSVEAADLDAGFVRLRWTIKTSTTNGKIFANNNYPLTVRVANTRLSGL
jgi:hypothetical protein